MYGIFNKGWSLGCTLQFLADLSTSETVSLWNC